jgi:hypothetical protein
MRLLYLDEDGYSPKDLLAEIGLIDRLTQVCRSSETMFAEIKRDQMQRYDVLLHVVGAKWKRALDQVEAVWQLRTEANYSVRPRHLIISAVEFNREIKYEFLKAGAHFIHLDEIRSLKKCLLRELDIIQLEIAEVTCNVPRFISIHEGNSGTQNCVPGEIPILRFRHGKAETAVKGPVTVVALITVMLEENGGPPRERKQWRERLSRSVFYEPRSGIVPVPSLTTLKTYLDQDIPESLQATFNELRSGFLVRNVLEHKELGNKAIGYRLLGKVIRRHRK